MLCTLRPGYTYWPYEARAREEKCSVGATSFQRQLSHPFCGEWNGLASSCSTGGSFCHVRVNSWALFLGTQDLSSNKINCGYFFFLFLVYLMLLFICVLKGCFLLTDRVMGVKCVCFVSLVGFKKKYNLFDLF